MKNCTETFHETNLKGKDAAQIMRVVRRLKKEINNLINTVEHPNYELRSMFVTPTEKEEISHKQAYLERAKEALAEAGVFYAPSASERESLDFNENVPYINKIVFSIGGFLYGYVTKTFTIDGDNVSSVTEHSLMSMPSCFDVDENEKIQKEEFFDKLKALRIGEWRKKYDTRRFNICVADGTQWDLEIYYSNGHRPLKIHGDNAYPYNFDNALEFFKIQK